MSDEITLADGFFIGLAALFRSGNWSIVLAAVIAALGAWWVAKTSYVAEKEKQRNQEARTEKRNALKDLLSARQMALHIPWKSEGSIERWSSVWTAASLVQLFSGDEMQVAVRNYLDELNSELRTLRDGAVLGDKERLSPEFVDAHNQLLHFAMKEMEK